MRRTPIRNPDGWCGPCSICGAVAWERWPHPEGEACPQKIRIDDAYVAMLDAQRMAYLRSAVAVQDGMESLRQLGEEGP